MSHFTFESAFISVPYSKLKLNCRAFALVTLGLYVTLSLVKMRVYALDGRFWAEEATRFYVSLHHASFTEAVTFLFNGHIELPTNLIVWVAAQAPLVHAPRVTTWLSFALQCLPVCLVVLLRQQFQLSTSAMLCWLVVLVGLPQAPEVWANSINLHFHFALAAAIVAAASTPTGKAAWGMRAVLLGAGLSGIPSNFLAPIFLWRASQERSTERWVQAGIVCMTTTLQLALLASSGFQSGDRSLPSNPLLYSLAILGQHLIGPLLGLRLGEEVAARLHGALQGDPMGTLIAISLGLIATHALHSAWKTNNKSLLTLLASGFLLSIMSIMTSLGNAQNLISTQNGGRYFYASNALFALAFLMARDYKTSSLRVQCVWVLLMIATVTHIPRYLPGQHGRQLTNGL